LDAGWVAYGSLILWARALIFVAGGMLGGYWWWHWQVACHRKWVGSGVVAVGVIVGGWVVGIRHHGSCKG